MRIVVDASVALSLEWPNVRKNAWSEGDLTEDPKAVSTFFVQKGRSCFFWENYGCPVFSPSILLTAKPPHGGRRNGTRENNCTCLNYNP
jgi:hypothetical protein